MNTLAIARRNLVRNARRSLATLLGIAIGVAAILLFGGYKINITYAMQTGYVRLGGHLQIQHRDYFTYGSGNPTAYGIAGFDSIIRSIQKDPYLADKVAVVTSTLQFGGVAGNYAQNVSRSVIGMGIDPDDHAAMRQWDPYRLDLPPLPLTLKGTSPQAAILGDGLARVLQLCDALKLDRCDQAKPAAVAAPEAKATKSSKPAKALAADLAALSDLEAMSAPTSAQGGSGARIEVLANNPRGAPNVVSLMPIGAESQGFKEWDEVYIVMHQRQAQRLIYGNSSPRATSILIQLHRTEDLASVQSYIEANLDRWSGAAQPLVVRDYKFLNPFYVQSINMFDTIFGFMFVLIGGIAIFTISNTMNTTVAERTVEIGTLRAIGLRQRGIQHMFVTEGALLGLAGAMLGAVSALLLAALINLLHLHWLPPGTATPLPLALNVWGEWRLLCLTLSFLIVVATVSAWWPARRASQLKVVEALRHA